MRKNYIISRYSGTKTETRFNVRVARFMAKKVLDEGFIPVVPHIYFTQFLDDRKQCERSKGVEIALDLLKECDKATVVIVYNYISDGMKAELKCVNSLGIPVRVINYKKIELKKLLRKNGV